MCTEGLPSRDRWYPFIVAAVLKPEKNPSRMSPSMNYFGASELTGGLKSGAQEDTGGRISSDAATNCLKGIGPWLTLL